VTAGTAHPSGSAPVYRLSSPSDTRRTPT
jgi:hypothetical protein